MQTIKITLQNENIDFFLALMNNLKIFSKIEIEEEQSFNELIQKPEGKPSIDDFSDIWIDKPKNIEQIRNKAWKKN